MPPIGFRFNARGGAPPCFDEFQERMLQKRREEMLAKSTPQKDAKSSNIPEKGNKRKPRVHAILAMAKGQRGSRKFLTVR